MTDTDNRERWIYTIFHLSHASITIFLLLFFFSSSSPPLVSIEISFHLTERVFFPPTNSCNSRCIISSHFSMCPQMHTRVHRFLFLSPSPSPAFDWERLAVSASALTGRLLSRASVKLHHNWASIARFVTHYLLRTFLSRLTSLSPLCITWVRYFSFASFSWFHWIQLTRHL